MEGCCTKIYGFCVLGMQVGCNSMIQYLEKHKVSTVGCWFLCNGFCCFDLSYFLFDWRTIFYKEGEEKKQLLSKLVGPMFYYPGTVQRYPWVGKMKVNVMDNSNIDIIPIQ